MAALTKKYGIMGALESAGLVESDNSLADVQPPTATPPPAQPYIYQPAPSGLSPVLNAEDSARLKTLESQVYATPSSYVIFKKLRETIGDAGGIGKLFEILSVANPGVTPAKVLADIDTHLSIIASKREDFDGQIARARAERIDGPAHQVSEMQAQIASLQAQIAKLQPDIQAANASITDGTTRFKAVEDQLMAPLIQAKQLITPLA